MSKINDKTQDFLEIFRMKEDTRNVESRNDLEAYKKRAIRKKRRRYLTVGAIVLLVLIGFLIVRTVMSQMRYNSYRVLAVNEQVDSSVLNYKELGDYVLRYSGDGVSLMDSTDDVIWNDSIQMNYPTTVSCGETVAIYETKGTEVRVYDLDGELGTIETEYPILKVSVSSLGGVAVILENEKNTLINYYKADGSLVASCSGNMRDPGYPIDVALSEDGISMAVSYLVADGSEISTYLALYNFGELGKNKEDNLLDGVRFEGVIVPKVEYLDEKTLLVYEENGFHLYKSSAMLEEIKTVTFEKEIISSFSDGDLFGFVFMGNGDRTFGMRVYDASGNVQMESGFDLSYDEIKISNGQIILYNADQFAIIASNGIVRYSGNFEEGSILDIVKRGGNRYSVACNKGVVDIKLN